MALNSCTDVEQATFEQLTVHQESAVIFAEPVQCHLQEKLHVRMYVCVSCIVKSSCCRMCKGFQPLAGRCQYGRVFRATCLKIMPTHQLRCNEWVTVVPANLRWCMQRGQLHVKSGTLKSEPRQMYTYRQEHMVARLCVGTSAAASAVTDDKITLCCRFGE